MDSNTNIILVLILVVQISFIVLVIILMNKFQNLIISIKEIVNSKISELKEANEVANKRLLDSLNPIKVNSDIIITKISDLKNTTELSSKNIVNTLNEVTKLD